MLQQQTNLESIRTLLQPSQGHQHHSVAAGHAKHVKALDSFHALFPPSMFKGPAEEGEQHFVLRVLRGSRSFRQEKFLQNSACNKAKHNSKGFPRPASATSSPSDPQCKHSVSQLNTTKMDQLNCILALSNNFELPAPGGCTSASKQSPRHSTPSLSLLPF